MLKTCKIYACTNGMLGLHMSRTPWDPYPWISGVQKDSNAQRGGLFVGDTLLELNGNDVLGQKISEIAEQIHEHWRAGATYLTMTVWRSRNDLKEEEGNQNVINQHSLQKFATCLQNIAQLLECPVCLEVIKPPGWQCCNGHVLCTNCRSRSEKCPVCRVPLGPRGRCLLSDKLFTLLAEHFPCDGVKNTGSSHKDSLKCTPKKAFSSNVEGSTTLTNRTQQRNDAKAKEIKKKVRSLCIQNETVFAQETTDEDEEIVQEGRVRRQRFHHKFTTEAVDKAFVGGL